MLVEFKSGSGPLKNMDQVKAWNTLLIFNHKARSFDIWYVTKIVQIMPLGKLISQVSDLGPSWPSCYTCMYSNNITISHETYNFNITGQSNVNAIAINYGYLSIKLFFSSNIYIYIVELSASPLRWR